MEARGYPFDLERIIGERSRQGCEWDFRSGQGQEGNAAADELDSLSAGLAAQSRDLSSFGGTHRIHEPEVYQLPYYGTRQGKFSRDPKHSSRTDSIAFSRSPLVVQAHPGPSPQRRPLST